MGIKSFFRKKKGTDTDLKDVFDLDDKFMLFLKDRIGKFTKDDLKDPYWFRNIKELKTLDGYKTKTKEEKVDKHIKKHAIEQRGELYPAAFDWRSAGESGKNYINKKVKWQGLCSSCVAFAAAGALEAGARIKKDIPVDSPSAGTLPSLSEAQLFFCSPGEKASTGWYPSEALQFCKGTGVAPESYFPWKYQPPWDYEKQKCDITQGWQDKVTKISAFHEISNPVEMKKWLSTRGPLITGMSLYLDLLFYKDGVYKKSTDFRNTKIGGHCILCIGYNDEKQAWLCKNSWTEDWGMDGYFWAGYGQCGIGQTMMAIDDFSEIYQETL
ncbi:MAG: hypothetical protein GY754_42545 [bacterium]|nr:hypothetical protein [bacterium]